MHLDVVDETYVDIVPGTNVCWRLYLKQNDVVTPSPQDAQVFVVTIEIRGEGNALLDTKDVYFVVPPVL